MPGIRIQHPTERSCTFTLVDSSRPLREAVECAVCHRVHTFKTYHLVLDEAGATIVSHEIVARLKRLEGNGGFQIGNQVKKPPAQVLRIGAPIAQAGVVEHPTLREPT